MNCIMFRSTWYDSVKFTNFKCGSKERNKKGEKIDNGRIV